MGALEAGTTDGGSASGATDGGDGGDDDAAPPDADARIDAGPVFSCANDTKGLSFCDDFQREGNLLGEWSASDELGTRLKLAAEGDNRFMRVTCEPSGPLYAALRRTPKNLKDAATIAMDVRATPAADNAGSARIFSFRLQSAAYEDRAITIHLGEGDRGSAIFASSDPAGQMPEVTSSATFTWPTAEWHHLQIAVDLKTKAVALLVDGKETAKLTNIVGFAPDDVVYHLGVPYRGSGASWTIDFDNVTIDETPND